MTDDQVNNYLREREAAIRLAWFSGYLGVEPSPKLRALLTGPPLPDDLPVPDDPGIPAKSARRKPAPRASRAHTRQGFADFCSPVLFRKPEQKETP